MEWVSVKDRLPEAKGHYLAIGKLNYAHGGTNESNDGDARRNMVIAYFDSTGLFNHPDITHWMPLPEPPKEETDGQ